MDILYLNTPLLDIKQEKYKALFTSQPQYLLNQKIKIPYFYNIPSNNFPDELNFKTFKKYYSQLMGAHTVFVNSTKLNKYACWLGLKTFWLNEGIILPKEIKRKKFFTPKLHIGYLPTPEIQNIMDNVIFSKKSNWEFHKYEDTPDFYEKCHIFLNPTIPHHNAIQEFPTIPSLKAMSHGCVLVSSNILNNYSHLLFDKVHYFNLDFVDTNTILSTLRYIDKRREKLDRMSRLSRHIVETYFNIEDITNIRNKVINQLV